MNVPGEDLPKVTHYYREPFPYVQQKVAVIGARNSAAKAALDCYRHGAQVTMIVRSAVLSDKIKYWIKPDLENRIKEGSIKALFNATVQEIREGSLLVETAEGVVEVENDWVLATTGYHPDYGFLEQLGLEFRDDGFRTPVYDEATFETTRPGVYIAGTVCGGYQTSRWFIENGRFHARQIARHIARGPRRARPVRERFTGRLRSNRRCQSTPNFQTEFSGIGSWKLGLDRGLANSESQPPSFPRRDAVRPRRSSETRRPPNASAGTASRT